MCATTPLQREKCVVSEADNDLKRDLECLRLASDFMRLSGAALNPELQEHCIRMAKYWSDQATGEQKTELGDPEGAEWAS
jgi:hypothetical protein